MSGTEANASLSAQHASPVLLDSVTRQAGAQLWYPNGTEKLPVDFSLRMAVQRVIVECRAFSQQVRGLFDENTHGDFVTRTETLAAADTWHRIGTFADIALSNLPDPLSGNPFVMYLANGPLHPSGTARELHDLLVRPAMIHWPFRPIGGVPVDSYEPVTVPGSIVTAIERIADALDDVIARSAPADVLPEDKAVPVASKPSLITSAVAVKKYAVTRVSLRRAVSKGNLQDYRKPGSPRNSSLIVDEAEVASNWPLKG